MIESGGHAARVAAAAGAGRAALRSIPKAALICALVACLNAMCWSIVTPAFEVPDEPDHFAYVKQLVDTGTTPTSHGQVAQEMVLVLEALRYYFVRQQPQGRTIGLRSEQQELEHVARVSIGSSHGSDAGVATSEPPLYYALEAIPYSLTRHRPVTDRLQLMRLFSALFAGLSALFVFLFVREALAGEPWTWTVAGLAVAVAPLLGFISGAVNPDSMLDAVSAAMFYLLARAFRHGLTRRRAVTIGVVCAIGLLTKLNFLGLVPGVLLGLAVLSLRVARSSPRRALVGFALGAGIGLAPAIFVAVSHELAHHPLLAAATGASAATHGSILREFNYIWQLYLPRIPGTVNDFPGLFTTRQIWFNGYVGLYGWIDTTFPAWVYNVALLPAAGLALLCARAVFQHRSAIRSRAIELVVYATLSVGVMVLIGAASYSDFPRVNAEFLEVRYLFPMLALLGGALALAVRGAGRRWGPAVGSLIVVLFLSHDILSQMLEVGRYYGAR